jgi:hypothetical protein
MISWQVEKNVMDNIELKGEVGCLENIAFLSKMNA